MNQEPPISIVLTRLIKGDERAFRAVYDRYHQQIYSFSIKFTHCSEDAQEIVQNTFVKLWQHRARLDPKLPIEPYLYKIAKNENLKALQKIAQNKTLREQLYQRMDSAVSTIEQEMILDEYTNIAQKAIALLPPKRKLVYEMAQKEGKTIREIASYMGTTPQTVRIQLKQALNFIKLYLKQHADISLGLLLSWLSGLF